jgi:predicted  nucleic acid-binding Zn-ribbon protein
MKTLLKKHISIATIFLLITCSTIYAQQSDYQIQQNFRAELSELLNRVELAISAEELEEISSDIDALQSQYSEHSDIINSALYPESFESTISNLREFNTSAYNNLSVIEQLNEQIEGLSAEMDEFRTRLTQMTAETTTLQQQIERAEANEQRQASLIRQYRQNIEQRDTFVADFMQELLSKYHRMDAATQQEIAESVDRLDQNPLDMIRTIITEYIQITDQSTGLQTPDYVAMRAQHGYFEEVWSQIDERLTTTFAPEGPVQARQEISDLLAAWLASIDNKLWDSMATAFNQNGINLQPFVTPDDFNTALNEFVDRAYEISLESNNEADYEFYQNFRDFWNNTVKASWGEALITGRILTPAQMAAIDFKLNNWGEAAQPTSNLMFILLLISIAIIVLLVVLLIVRKK